MRPRDEVWGFAEAMEAILRKNDDKGGWDRCDMGYLLARLKEETAELEEALRKGVNLSTPMNRKIRKEACDVANFCMMIFDNAQDI